MNQETQKQNTQQLPKQPRIYHCNDCGGDIHRHEVFCSHCGKKLDHFDFED